MGQVAVEDGAHLLSLAQLDQSPFGAFAVGMVHLGRVDPGQADAGAADVDGVTVDHSGSPAQFEHLHDKDFTGTALACGLARRQPLFKRGVFGADDSGAAQRRIKTEAPASSSKATARAKCHDGTDNKQQRKKQLHRIARQDQCGQFEAVAVDCQLELPWRMA